MIGCMVFGAEMVAFRGCMHAWTLVFILSQMQCKYQERKSIKRVPVLVPVLASVGRHWPLAPPRSSSVLILTPAGKVCPIAMHLSFISSLKTLSQFS